MSAPEPTRSAYIRAKHRHRSRSDARDSERLTKCVGAHLGKTLNDLLRQPRDPSELKVLRYPPALVASRTLYLALLPPQIARILDFRLDARDVDSLSVSYLEWHRTIDDEIRETNLWLSEQMTREHTTGRSRSNLRFIQQLQVPQKPSSACLETGPALLIDQTDRMPERRQPQIRVVNTKR